MRRSKVGLTRRSVQAARLTFPEAPGQGARRGGWPAHSRSPLSERGGSSRGSGNKEVETRTRARIPGARGAPAPRPRPATHGTESREPLSPPFLGVVIWGCRGQAWEHRFSLQALHRRLPRAPGVKPRGARGRQQGHGRRRGTGSAALAAATHLSSLGKPVPAALAARRKRPAARDCLRPLAQAQQSSPG